MNKRAMSGDASDFESIEVPDSRLLPRERSFGLTFAGIGLIAAGLLYYQHAAWSVVFCATAVAALFASAALSRPSSLAGLNKAWFRLGLALGRIVNPLVMAMIFFGIVTPVAVVTRLVGRDVIKRRFDAHARSYWVDRVPPGPTADSFKNQF